jgi:hypothetical protein
MKKLKTLKEAKQGTIKAQAVESPKETLHDYLQAMIQHGVNPIRTPKTISFSHNGVRYAKLAGEDTMHELKRNGEGKIEYTDTKKTIAELLPTLGYEKVYSDEDSRILSTPIESGEFNKWTILELWNLSESTFNDYYNSLNEYNSSPKLRTAMKELLNA